MNSSKVMPMVCARRSTSSWWPDFGAVARTTEDLRELLTSCPRSPTEAVHELYCGSSARTPGVPETALSEALDFTYCRTCQRFMRAWFRRGGTAFMRVLLFVYALQHSSYYYLFSIVVGVRSTNPTSYCYVTIVQYFRPSLWSLVCKGVT